MYRAFYFSLIELASLWFALVIMEEMALWQREGRSSSCGAGLLHPIGEMMSLVHPFCKVYISFHSYGGLSSVSTSAARAGSAVVSVGRPVLGLNIIEYRIYPLQKGVLKSYGYLFGIAVSLL